MKSVWVLWIYCVLLLGGGFAGWYFGGSQVSLISSSLAASILFCLSFFVAKQKRMGLVLSLSFLALLDTFFTYRWLSAGSTPAGMMAALSLLALFGFAFASRKEFAAKSKS